MKLKFVTPTRSANESTRLEWSFFCVTVQWPLRSHDAASTLSAIRNEPLLTVGAKLPSPVAVNRNCSGVFATLIERFENVAISGLPLSGWVFESAPFENA